MEVDFLPMSTLRPTVAYFLENTLLKVSYIFLDFRRLPRYKDKQAHFLCKAYNVSILMFFVHHYLFIF